MNATVMQKHTYWFATAFFPPHIYFFNKKWHIPCIVPYREPNTVYRTVPWKKCTGTPLAYICSRLGLSLRGYHRDSGVPHFRIPSNRVCYLNADWQPNSKLSGCRLWVSRPQSGCSCCLLCCVLSSSG